MKTQTKKTILNIVMAAAIVAIVAAGVLAVGGLRGWFGGDTVTVVQPDGAVKTVEVVARNKIGNANIERNGVAYALKDGNRLRDGDIIQTLNGSSIDIVFGESAVGFDENSSATVRISATGGVSVELANGGVFASISEPFTLRLMDTDVSLESGVFSASAPYGSASVYVFENAATVGGMTIRAGDGASILQDGIHTAALSIQSLNRFDLARVAAANQSRSLCFTGAQVAQLVAEREASLQEAAQAQLLEEENAQRVEQQRQENEKNQAATGGNTGSHGGGTGGNTGGGATGPTCTITIRCDTILDNMGDLTEGKNKYVPANGCILATSKLQFEEGETVFDVLKRACKLAGIQLEYSWTPMYNSYYTTSDSMRSRGYSLKGRTAFSIYRFDNRDRNFVIALFSGFTVLLAGILLDQTNILYDPEIILNRITPLSFVFYAAYAFLCLLPMALQIMGECRFRRQTTAARAQRLVTR